MRYKRGEILHVEWYDAVSHDPWVNVDDIDFEPIKIQSVGFFVTQTPEAIILSGNHDTRHDNYACTIVIPTPWLVKIKRVNSKPRARKPKAQT